MVLAGTRHFSGGKTQLRPRGCTASVEAKEHHRSIGHQTANAPAFALPQFLETFARVDRVDIVVGSPARSNSPATDHTISIRSAHPWNGPSQAGVRLRACDKLVISGKEPDMRANDRSGT